MARVERFEDLIAWQKARELTKDIYVVTREGQFSKDFGLSGQIQRASVSTMSNIAEGFDRSGPTEFHKFLTIARASNSELRSHLCVALDVGYIKTGQFSSLYNRATEVARILSGLRSAVADSRPGK